MSSPKHYSCCRVKISDSALVKSLAVSLKDYNNGAMFRGAFGRIDKTAASDDYYVQIFDSETLPDDGTSTAGNLLVSSQQITHVNGTDSRFSIDALDDFIKAKNGIVVLVSTTEFTVTLIGSDSMSATIFYK